jgi:hypothetical protein
VEALDIIADEQAAHGKPAIGPASNHGKHIDDGQMPQEMFRCVVEHVAHGIFRAPHDPLHPVHRPQVVAAVDALAASRAHQDVLVVIGHADHFMGHNLADGKNKIEAAPRDEPVDLGRPCVVQLALRLFADELCGNFPERLDIGSPVVNAEQILRHIRKHIRDLLRPHGGVCAEGGKNRLETVAIILPGIAGQLTCAGVRAALIGRHGEDTIAFSERGKACGEQFVQLLRR